MALNILKAFALASVRFQACSFSFRCGFRNATVARIFGKSAKRIKGVSDGSSMFKHV